MFPITSERRFFYTVQDDPYEAAHRLRYYLSDRLAGEGASKVKVEDRLREFFNSPSTWGVQGELITSR